MLLNNPKYADLPVFLTKNRYTNDFNLILNNNSIKAALKNIILTQNGERPFDKNFGSTIQESLFATKTSAVLNFELLNSIYPSIAQYEPRIDPQTIKIRTEIQENTLLIFIEAMLQNSDETVTVTITL